MSYSNVGSRCELVRTGSGIDSLENGAEMSPLRSLPVTASSPNLVTGTGIGSGSGSGNDGDRIEINFGHKPLHLYQSHAAAGEMHQAASSGNLSSLVSHNRNGNGNGRSRTRSSGAPVTAGLKKNYSNVSLDTLADDHMLNVDDFCRKLDTNRLNGLSQAEADRRLVRDGPNLLSPKKKVPKFVLFIKELFTGFGPLYWAATVLSVISYCLLPNSSSAIYNLIIAAILFVALIGTTLCRFLQLQTATDIMDKFLQMMPSNMRVLRDGRWIEIPTPQLVVGDVVSLSAGDKFPADVRAIEVSHARIDKSSLTGETKPIKMTTEGTDNDLNETRNVGFFGTNLLEGTVKAVVFNVGDRTMMGQLAHLSISTKRRMTTLERDIYYFSIGMSSIAIMLCVVIVLFWVFWLDVYANGFLGLPGLLSLCTGLIVAFFPEGLAIAVTATLMLSAKRMRKVNVLVKNLNIMDTLGATSVICSDKTGTITQNKMSLSHVWMVPTTSSSPSIDGRLNISSPLTLRGSDADAGALDLLDMAANEGNGWLHFALSLCGLCNNASIDEQTGKVSGSATESALLTAAAERVHLHELRQVHELKSQIPFDSARKYQLNVHEFAYDRQRAVSSECLGALESQVKSARSLVIVKGGSEIIVDMCHHCMHGTEVKPFTEALKRQSLDAMQMLAARGERVLGIGFCFSEIENLDAEVYEDTLKSQIVFLGLLSLVDPPRPGVADAVGKCHGAGIRVMMVTGDHPATAAAIARKVNIFDPEAAALKVADVRDRLLAHRAAGFSDLPAIDPVEPLVVLGKELATMTDDEWSLVLKYRSVVYARTTPENKLEIVRHYQARGEIVAATGDGVNDSAALKKAHVGIAMALAGSEISKEAANLILMDDNFSSIVAGIEQGRLLFDNLRKVVCYLLPASCFTEVLAVLANTFLGIPLPLSSFLMIVPCVSTDIAGAISMVHEPAESDLMRRRPRKKSDHLFDYKVLIYDYSQLGVIDAVINFVTFFVVMYYAGGCRPDELLFAWTWGVAPTASSSIDYNSSLAVIANQSLSTSATATMLTTTTTAVSNFTYCGLDYNGQNNLLPYGQTGYFVALVITQCWNVLACSRTRHVSVFKQKFRRSLIVAVYVELTIVLFMVFVPFVNTYLLTAPVNWYAFGIPLVMGLAMVGFDESRKYLIRRYPRSCLAKIAW